MADKKVLLTAETDMDLLRLRLKDIRKSKYISQRELGKIAGLSTSTVNRLENVNLLDIRVSSLIKYLSALDYKVRLTPTKMTIVNNDEGDNK